MTFLFPWKDSNHQMSGHQSWILLLLPNVQQFASVSELIKNSFQTLMHVFSKAMKWNWSCRSTLAGFTGSNWFTQSAAKHEETRSGPLISLLRLRDNKNLPPADGSQFKLKLGCSLIGSESGWAANQGILPKYGKRRRGGTKGDEEKNRKWNNN